jgi:hypothetical protein
MEISVSTAEGVCDFISAMDTSRIQEWNTWYHLLNCGFGLKVSGETDFPCMSSRQVGQGRVYVQLGKIERLDFGAWSAGLAAGRSYVSDGYAHAVDFRVNGMAAGQGDVKLDESGKVSITSRVAFADQQPLSVAHGGVLPAVGKREAGDTVLIHGPRSAEMEKGGQRLVEVVVNGRPVAQRKVPADGAIHDLQFEIPIDKSSWVAIREFPQLHTNPVNVIVAGRPVRASKSSARWCSETIKLLWRNRERNISAPERDEAKRTFDRAVVRYEQIAAECADDAR